MPYLHFAAPTGVVERRGETRLEGAGDLLEADLEVDGQAPARGEGDVGRLGPQPPHALLRHAVTLEPLHKLHAHAVLLHNKRRIKFIIHHFCSFYSFFLHFCYFIFYFILFY